MHSGMYGMYALQESVRQKRGIAPAQIPDAKISVCHGVAACSPPPARSSCRTSWRKSRWRKRYSWPACSAPEAGVFAATG
jgi:hypothetical protein